MHGPFVHVTGVSADRIPLRGCTLAGLLLIGDGISFGFVATKVNSFFATLESITMDGL